MLKGLKVGNIVTEDYVEIDVKETLSKSLPKFTDSKDVLVVLEDGKYKGVLTHKEALRTNIPAHQTKIKSIYRSAPRLSKDVELGEVARLMVESNLFHLPVIEHETIVGVVKGDDILKEFQKIKQKYIAASEVMTSNPAVITKDYTLAKTLVTFREHNISRLPIVEEGRIIGIISLKDIINQNIYTPREGIHKYHIIDEKNSVLDIHVKELMNTEVVTSPPSEDVKDILKKMFEKDISSIIIAEKGKIEGITTKKDLLEKIAYESKESESEIFIQISSKAQIDRKTILEELKEYAEKHKNQLGPGYISVHIAKHKESLKGKPLLLAKLRIRCKEMYDVKAEDYGEDLVIKEALRKLKEMMIKRGKKKYTNKEILEYTNVSEL